MEHKQLPEFSQAAQVRPDDLLYLVDVSDLTDSAAGSSRKIPLEYATRGINGKHYAGAKGDDSTDDSSAIQTIIDAMELLGTGREIYFPAGTYLCQGLTVADDSKIKIVGDGVATVFKKNANGEVINLGKQCTLENLAIDGNGATYTGVGVLINTGALDNFSWRRILNVDIYETASYCIEFTGNRAGYASHIEVCRLVPRTSSYTAAIKMANNGGVTESNGNRMIERCWSFSQPIADLTDAVNTDIIGCHGDLPIFAATTAKTSITGGRLNIGSSDWTLRGTANTISGLTVNSDGGDVVFHSGCTNCRWASSNVIGSGIGVTDNSDGANSGNEMHIPSQVYTPTWTATANPAIGNGNLSGQYVRRGLKCALNIQLVPGSTTTFGTGAWSFSLPYTASNRRQVGSAYILDADGVTIWTGTAVIASGEATTLRVVSNGSTAAYTGHAVPHAWAQSDELVIDIDYNIK